MINEENVLRGGEQSAGGWVPSECAGALGDKRAAAALATVRCFAVSQSDQWTWLEPCLLFCRRGMDQWMDVATF